MAATDDVPTPVAVIDEASHPQLDRMSFDGTADTIVNVPHEGRAAGLAQTSGTVALTFVVNAPGEVAST